MPLVVKELRESIPSVYGHFTWPEERGRVTNAWSDRFLPRRAAWIILHFERYAIDAGISIPHLLRIACCPCVSLKAVAGPMAPAQ
ncbi:hypothetical protein QTI24_30505 [Variovorax sp. J22P240]|uniref:hypothetical protein n=1 Tax=Variovorax sp. J22P240 TaxID=3053514 RepID=UPI002574BC46|nr:hypothetical protein [Variovorax sp. J22P240]MDM0002954.1 hypothetical protein [Variovorax sp. J22P240]